MTLTLKAALNVLAQATLSNTAHRPGIGVSLADSSWVIRMAKSSHAESAWTARMRWYAYEVCGRYTEQLATHGYDFGQIPKPPDPSKLSEFNEQVAKTVQRAVVRNITFVSSGHYTLHFPYEKTAIEALRLSVPNRVLDWMKEPKHWRVKFHLDPVDGKALADFLIYLGKWGYKVPSDVSVDIQYLLGLAIKQEHDRDQAYTASFATDAKLDIPGLKGTLRGFQMAGVAYLIEKKRAFLADDMGLGKTVQAIAVTEHQKAYPALFVTKASLRKNWLKELKAWIPDRKATTTPTDMQYRFMDILVVSYEGLVKNYSLLEEIDWRSITLDESHSIKNNKAKRTQAAKDIAKVSKAPIRLCLSGTPMEIAPYELAPQLTFLGQMEAIGGSKHFYDYFCNGDTQGSANEKELNALLRKTAFIRREKKDVLTELPAKQRSFQPLEIDNMAEYKRAEADIIAWLKGDVARNPDAYEFDADALINEGTIEAKQAHVADRASGAEALVRIAKLKQLAMQGMLESAKQWIEDFIESGEKLVVFAYHIEAQRQIWDMFKDLAVWTGNAGGSQAAVDEFQTNPKIKIIVCSLKRDKEGHTLTAASNVCFVERGWTSTQHDQAEDRCILEGMPILTPTGWTRIEEIKVGDMVVASDGQPHRVIDAWSKGNLKETVEIEMEGFNMPIVTTHDHPFLLSNGTWANAETLRPGSSVAMPAITPVIDETVSVEIEARFRTGETFINNWGREQKNGRMIVSPERIELTDDALFSLGYFAGSGFSAIKDKGVGGCAFGFCGNTGTKAEPLNRIERWIKSIGLPVHWIKAGLDDGREIRINCQQLAKWFAFYFGKSLNRSLHPVLLTLNLRQSKVVLSGLAASDGYTREGRMEYVTQSDTLSGQVAWLIMRCGYKPCVTENSTGQRVISYTIGVPPTLLVSKVSFRHPKKPDGARERVYDITVEGASSFVVGTAVVHNCHRIGQRDSVTCWYLVAQGTIYEDIDKLIESRRTLVDAITNGTRTGVTNVNIAKDLIRQMAAA